jgi:hypothetical protein
MQTEAQTELYYWIAINGASAAMSPMAMPKTVKVIPTPQHLIGFSDYEMAKAAQHILLTAPVSQIIAELNALLRRSPQHKVEDIHPEHPEPPTHGPTMWLDGPA